MFLNSLSMDFPAKRVVNPRNAILDLMGVCHPNVVSFKQIGLLATVFAFSENNIRVALTRLVSQGWIENSQRGQYGLSEKGQARLNFSERWQANELRLNKWNGSWLGCHLPKGGQRTVRKHSLNALAWYGFQEGLDQLWVRPNNLKLTASELRHELERLGLELDAQIFTLQAESHDLEAVWLASWPTEQLNHIYAALTDRLSKKLPDLTTIPPKLSLKDTCILGGEVIHYLAKDPQLPDEIHDRKQYDVLKKTMMQFDACGRKIWRQELNKLGVAGVNLIEEPLLQINA